MLATALAVVLFFLFETRLPPAAGETSVGSDAVLVALINFNLILLVLLVFLVARNVVKLILDRRARILGAHLRTRLVVAFVAIAFFPATLLFIVALSFTGNSIENWFNAQVESALEGSLQVTNTYYRDLASNALGFARKTAERLGAHPGLLARGRRAELRRLLAERRDEYQLDLVEVFANGRVLARSRRPDLPEGGGTDPLATIVRQAQGGADATVVERWGEADLVRAAVPVFVDGVPRAAVVVDAYVPRSVVSRREAIDQSFREYLRLKIQRRPIQTAYTLTLALVTIVVLFAATWIGFYVARGITVPIQRLAEGTRAVAQGELDHRIEEEADDEIGTLVRAFNQMTADLQAGRAELEARRRYLETVLGHITAGVVSADATGRVTTMNNAAAALLGMSAEACVGRRLDEVFAAEPYGEIRQLVGDLLHEPAAGPPCVVTLGGPVCQLDGGDTRGAAVERPLRLERDGQEVALLVAGTRLRDEAGHAQGIVLFLEDFTHLLRVQRMEAWREVARRIAHEIKNPLTPIQLSAQRLRRRYAAQLREPAFDECTRTIIQQVEELKQLVNEFATFARMPAGRHTPQDLNRLVDEALVLFREGHRDIDFAFTAAPAIPVLELDREGVKRAVINILDNAVAACAARDDFAPGERPRVTVRTGFDAGLGVVRLEIADNGTGMTPEVRGRIFEPYFSTKADGSGLGLAIVSSIVKDHSGFVRVRDNQPRGTRFVMEFPVRRQAAQVAAHARREAYERA